MPVVTFLVTPEQAETLALASQQGSIQLALRNQLDTMRGEDHGHPAERADGRSRSAGPLARRPGSRSARRWPRRPQPSQQVVEVYRGGARTLMKF